MMTVPPAPRFDSRRPGLAGPAAGALGRAAPIVQAPRRREPFVTTSMAVSVSVGVDPATAFTAFTEDLDLWWVRGGAEVLRALVCAAGHRPRDTGGAGPPRGGRVLRQARRCGPVAGGRLRLRVAGSAAGRTRPASRGRVRAPVDRVPGGELLA